MMSITGSLTALQDFLDRLEKASIHYKLGAPTPRTFMVEVVVPGERWEVEFHSRSGSGLAGLFLPITCSGLSGSLVWIRWIASPKRADAERASFFGIQLSRPTGLPDRLLGARFVRDRRPGPGRRPSRRWRAGQGRSSRRARPRHPIRRGSPLLGGPGGRRGLLGPRRRVPRDLKRPPALWRHPWPWLRITG
jgi:hypothetical protein